MAQRGADAGAISRDPDWLAHRYDARSDRIHYVHAPRTLQREATFLTDAFLPDHGRPHITARSSALAANAHPGPVHFIFHSAYCCSTLLARAFDIEGVSFGLKEPQILNDIAGWRRRGGAPGDVARVLDSVLTLLAKPFRPGEAIIIKPSNVINALAPAIMATRPQSRALLLHAPLPLFLASIPEKGMWGRLWVRELFIKLAKDGVTDYGFTADEILQQTDLQIAAIGWLAQHRLFAALAQRFGPGRVRTLDSEELVADPLACMTRLNALFDLKMNADMLEAVAAGPAFTRHSKTGVAFGGSERRGAHRDRFAAHAEEVEKVAEWARTVAAAAGQPMVLPAPLLD